MHIQILTSFKQLEPLDTKKAKPVDTMIFLNTGLFITTLFTSLQVENTLQHSSTALTNHQCTFLHFFTGEWTAPS